MARTLLRAACALSSAALAIISAQATALAAQQQPAGGMQDLVQQTQNPVANLVSVPFQNNWDFGVGPDDDPRWTLNVLPVIPVELNEDWNVIGRVIAPLIASPGFAPGADGAFGLGDINVSAFLSPAKPGTIIWGVGPSILLPTAFETPELGVGEFGAGPTGVVLTQRGRWTFAFLANHVWTFGDAGASLSLFQPVVSYAWPSGWGVSVMAEAIRDWDGDTWTTPITLAASKILAWKGQLMSVGGGVRYFVDTPSGQPDWGLRAAVTLLFPKR